MTNTHLLVLPETAVLDNLVATQLPEAQKGVHISGNASKLKPEGPMSDYSTEAPTNNQRLR